MIILLQDFVGEAHIRHFQDKMLFLCLK